MGPKETPKRSFAASPLPRPAVSAADIGPINHFNTNSATTLFLTRTNQITDTAKLIYFFWNNEFNRFTTEESCCETDIFNYSFRRYNKSQPGTHFPVPEFDRTVEFYQSNGLKQKN